MAKIKCQSSDSFELDHKFIPSSPERQNLLAGNRHITRAKSFQSYHQFDLAADIAFKRNSKVVISERDPEVMK